MAGFFQEVIKGAGEGFFGNPMLRDAQHASKTFRTNGYGNAPKLKFLFHVYFEINDSMISSNAGAFPEKSLPGLLVKNITLPKYTMTLAEMNQYNRPKYVQTKIKYDPVQIAFHDDNLGAVKKIWHNYFSYYYNDSSTASKNPTSIATSNTYDASISNQNWGYQGEPPTSSLAASVGKPKPSFFKSIKIYGFNQHSFSLYTLVNPVIERFEHDTYDYSQATGIMENRMTVRYETVTYSEGALNGESPDSVVQGFGKQEYYDRTLSPISRPGSNRTIMGPGGLYDAGQGILADLDKQPPDLLGAIQKAGTAYKTFKSQDLKAMAKAELLGAAKQAAASIDGAAVRATFNNFFSFKSAPADASTPTTPDAVSTDSNPTS
jgi:hypothetical protein